MSSLHLYLCRFPEVEFFKKDDVRYANVVYLLCLYLHVVCYRDIMISILFCYAKEHTDIGYRQVQYDTNFVGEDVFDKFGELTFLIHQKITVHNFVAYSVLWQQDTRFPYRDRIFYRPIPMLILMLVPLEFGNIKPTVDTHHVYCTFSHHSSAKYVQVKSLYKCCYTFFVCVLINWCA